MAEDPSNTELVCTLTSAEFLERKNALQKEIFSQVRRAEELDDGYRFYFTDADDQLLPSLFQYILAEKECCPFFRHVATIEPHNGGIIWEVSGSGGAKEILTPMIEELSLSGN